MLVGTVIVSVSATVGAALAFLIARYLARGKIEQKVSSNQKFKQIDRAIGAQGAKLVFLLRLSPLIPFNVSNYFYGLTAVRFWPYVLASWIGTLPGTNCSKTVRRWFRSWHPDLNPSNRGSWAGLNGGEAAGSAERPSAHCRDAQHARRDHSPPPFGLRLPTGRWSLAG